MKNAFAKLLKTNPTQSSSVVFGPGGNDVPILTRASGQSTAGYQTMGLPGGKSPFPGGGANITTLGAYRMGEDDGNGAGSAIYPGEIFPPIPPAGRTYPQRMFENVGNNVYQPENDGKATLALLKRLGDQKFKAEAKAPFEDYMAQQRLARDINEAAKSASLTDLGTAREIIRNMAEERRQQSEDDYLRRMLDAGMTPEAARKEIEDVRNAKALQEARKVDDRPYQAKLLINKIAASRGVTSMVKEPLSQSAAIDNPDRSQATAQAMGVQGGFGTAPLDANRQFLTPDFYRRFLRRSNQTQESIDEQQAFNSLLSRGQLGLPPTGSYSLANVRGEERLAQIENASDALASRLDNLRERANRIKLPLPSVVIFKDTLDSLYNLKNKKKGVEVIYSPETIEDLRPLQTVIALNLLVQTTRDGLRRLTDLVNSEDFGTPEAPAVDIFPKLKKIALNLNGGVQEIRLPFASDLRAVERKKLMDEIRLIQAPPAALRAAVEKGGKEFFEKLRNTVAEPLGDADIDVMGAGPTVKVVTAPKPAPAGPSSLFAELNPFKGPSRQELASDRKTKDMARQLGLTQVNLTGAEPQPAREMRYGASYGQQGVGRPPAQGLFEAFDSRLAARDVVSAGRMLQTDKRRTPYVDAIKQARANIKGGLAPKSNAPALPLMPIQQVITPAAVPTKTALNKMSAGDVENVMDSLGYPRQGGKKKNIEYINARR
jgi:hypothetical protein